MAAGQKSRAGCKDLIFMRYTGPKHKLCRREGVKLCDSPKCPITRRNYPPGIHGVKGKRRLTPYGKQLREKQKARSLYGIAERQFRNYYLKAIKLKGDTGQIMIDFLERRLDNVVYRSGLAKSRQHARQLVSHGFFHVNGKRMDIPSYQVKVKDVISIKQGKAEKKVFLDLDKTLQKHETPLWLHVDAKKMEIKVTSQPETESMSLVFNPQAIVEYYSR